jgi:TatA/E family protein of Tat protein translocase
MPSLGPAEILVILVVALLVFGPEKMPDIARQVGKGMREFKRVQQHLKSELRDVVSEFDVPSSGTPPVEVDPVPMLPPKDDPGVPAPDPAPAAETPSGGAPPADMPDGDRAAESAPEPGPPAEPA